MSDGITAREVVPSGMANAAAPNSTKPSKTASFFIGPLGNTHLDAESACRVNPIGNQLYAARGQAGTNESTVVPLTDWTPGLPCGTPDVIFYPAQPAVRLLCRLLRCDTS